MKLTKRLENCYFRIEELANAESNPSYVAQIKKRALDKARIYLTNPWSCSKHEGEAKLELAIAQAEVYLSGL